MAHARGLVSGPGGNISARLPGSNLVLIKASGVPFRDMRPGDVVVVDLDGNVVEGRGGPSKEVRFHLGIYRARPDVGAVLHTHSPWASAYAALGRPIPLVVAWARDRLGRVPVVGYAPPGSAELARMVVEAFRDPRVSAALLKDHGVVVAGRDLRDALDLAEVVEDAAKVAALCELLSSARGVRPGEGA